jgi:transcriptional regulator with XRE-family HTH domain
VVIVDCALLAAKIAAKPSMSSAGAGLYTLRILAGLPQDAVARRAGISVARLSQIEGKGAATPSDIAALCRVYGVDPATLIAEGALSAPRDLDGIEDAALFLFSGDVSDMPLIDLTPVAAALDLARARARTEEGRRGARARWSLSPVGPTGPAPINAARQGHLLARTLRNALGIAPDAPIQFDALLQALGVVVTAAPLARPKLRALAVLDRDRAAAAIVLNQTVEDGRAVLQRVALAHALCHLLYDPVSAAVCNVVMDQLSQGRVFDIRESRARGFAAELLLPLAGLRSTLGPPTRVQARDQAEALIERARSAFPSPWEIACNHLYNDQFHDLGPADQWTAGAQGWKTDPHVEVVPMAAIAPIDPQAVPRAQTAQKAARASQETLEAQWNSRAQARIVALRAAEDPVPAAVSLGAEMDQAFTEGRVAEVRALLVRLDPHEVEGEAMVSLLSCLRQGCEHTGLGETYRILAARTKDALSRTWGWTADDMDGADAVLGL